jgi:hypothetical protein
MRHELGNCLAQRALAEQDQAIQAGLLHGTYESLRVGIQIGGLWRKLDGLDTHPGQQVQKFCGEEGITIMDQITLAIQDSVHGIGDPPANLAHPEAIGGGGDTRHLALARRQIEKEQHHKALESFSRPHFHGKEISGHDPFPVSRQKFLPGRLAVPFGSGLPPVSFQNVSNGAARPFVSQMR